ADRSGSSRASDRRRIEEAQSECDSARSRQEVRRFSALLRARYVAGKDDGQLRSEERRRELIAIDCVERPAGMKGLLLAAFTAATAFCATLPLLHFAQGSES